MDSWCRDAEMLCAMFMSFSCLDSCADCKLHAMCAVLHLEEQYVSTRKVTIKDCFKYHEGVVSGAQ
jgi:uncharacterized protein (UPF0179 family)